MKKFLPLLFALLLATLLWLPAQAGRVLNDTLVTRPFGHHLWQEVLTRHVSGSGEIDLVRLRAYPKRLSQYLAQLEAVSPDSHPDYFPSRADTTAYWLNAHNALALRLVLDAYPVTRVDAIPDFLSNSRYKLGGKPYSLSAIRSRLAGADVMFALSDYSRSAPPLLPRAYDGAILNTQLQQARSLTLQSGQLVQFKRAKPGGCVEILVSPFFQDFRPGSPEPSTGEAEDRDVLSDEPPPQSATPTWQDVFREFAPPDVYADLGKPCAHAVRFMPARTDLRQVAPF